MKSSSVNMDIKKGIKRCGRGFEGEVGGVMLWTEKNEGESLIRPGFYRDNNARIEREKHNLLQ